LSVLLSVSVFHLSKLPRTTPVIQTKERANEAQDENLEEENKRKTKEDKE
jgi:hypothetical protein